ncbi:MAG: hypothetical protein R2867_22745 [Caldilineaceae bacterium]
MVVEAAGLMTFGDKGDMTKEEIDQITAILMEQKPPDSFVPFGKPLMNR